MISNLFHNFIYIPLYNGLIALLDIGSWVDVGIAIIVLTVIVKAALFRLSIKAARTQRIMKELEEPMKEIREKYKDDREKQGRKMLELYRKYKVNPFSSFLVIFIQLPVIFGLYWVFAKGGLPNVDTSLLYSFVPIPENINMHFLGVIDMASKNMPLAILAGISQHLQFRFAMPKPKPKKENPTFQEDLARSMQMQMKYIMPFFIMFVAYVASAGVALYWITSNIFAIGQEIFVKKHIEEEKEKNKK